MLRARHEGDCDQNKGKSQAYVPDHGMRAQAIARRKYPACGEPCDFQTGHYLCGLAFRGEFADNCIARDFPLRAVLEVAHLRGSARKFVFANNHGVSGIHPARDRECRLEPPIWRQHFRTQTASAQLMRESHRDEIRLLAYPDQRNVGTSVRFEISRLHRERCPLDADREPSARNRRAAEFLDQPVVASSRRHGALGAYGSRYHLERGARVIVEPAHQARFRLERNVGAGEKFLHRVKMFAAFVAQIIEALRRGLRDALRVDLAVEQPERIALEPLMAVLAQLFEMRASVFEQRRPKPWPA